MKSINEPARAVDGVAGVIAPALSTIGRKWGTGRYFHVPYRSLAPRGIGNLLVAGRSIGGR
jgi:hypothetical protein